MGGWEADVIYECDSMDEFTKIQKYYIRKYDTYWNHFTCENMFGEGNGTFIPQSHNNKFPIYLVIMADWREFGWTRYPPSETSVVFDKIIPAKQFLREQKIKRINK